MMTAAHPLFTTISAVSLLAAAWSVPAGAVAQDSDEVINRSDDPLLRPFRWRSVGPAGEGGRVDDIAVDPVDSRIYYVGFATGGLWRTKNNGTTFEPIFDGYETHSIGAIAIAHSDPRIVYVGTGEANNRQSSSFGVGMYKSTDGGDSFQYIGLRRTQSIARVVVHPFDPETVWVAATGHLFGPNPDRGVFKTTDGGRTWRHVLAVDEDTGATDLIIDPANPEKLLAATYQRRRSACCFVGGGPGSGIWMSTDGGESWRRLHGNGLPDGTMGRIALATAPADPLVVYAQIEVAADHESPLTDEQHQEWEALAQDHALRDPEWSGVWRSTDGGRSWHFRANQNARPTYFSQIRVSPRDADVVYVADVDVLRSTDGGLTFEQLDGYGHIDQHALWIDPSDDDHMMIGNDGSVDVTYDQGRTWESLRSWAASQSYHASVDMQRPYRICTGLQDNGSWCGPNSVRTGPILAQDWFRVGGADGFYSQIDPTHPNIVYTEAQGGRMSRVDLATGEQRPIRPVAPSNGQGGATNISPAPPENTEIRWNWSTPLLLSPHDPDMIYAGANRLFISTDRGETWTMSPDLTKQLERGRIMVMGQRNDLPQCAQLERGRDCILSRNDGVTSWGTGVSIAESPVAPGVLWVGTDDGNIQVSRDGGATWTEVSRNLPSGTTEYYVSRVEASHFDAGSAYVSIDGHRSDDLRPYVYVTHDYGQTWTSITSGLPRFGNVRTVRQDPRNPDLLYVGTEFGFFVSINGGREWHRFMNGLPVTRVDDVLVHPRENDLVLATHGRSIYVMDDVTALQSATAEVLSRDVHLFPPREAVLWKRDRMRERSLTGDKNWSGAVAPTGMAISYWLASDQSDVRLTISDPVSGETFRTLDATGLEGMNRIQWNLRGDLRRPDRLVPGAGPMARPGHYRVRLALGEEYVETTATVLEDVWLGER